MFIISLQTKTPMRAFVFTTLGSFSFKQASPFLILKKSGQLTRLFWNFTHSATKMGPIPHNKSFRDLNLCSFAIHRIPAILNYTQQPTPTHRNYKSVLWVIRTGPKLSKWIHIATKSFHFPWKISARFTKLSSYFSTADLKLEPRSKGATMSQDLWKPSAYRPIKRIFHLSQRRKQDWSETPAQGSGLRVVDYVEHREKGLQKTQSKTALDSQLRHVLYKTRTETHQVHPVLCLWYVFNKTQIHQAPQEVISSSHSIPNQPVDFINHLLMSPNT